MSKSNLPICVQAMGCACAGHARGNDASMACDTSEQPDTSEIEWDEDGNATCPCGGEIELIRTEGFSLTRDDQGSITANPKTFPSDDETKVYCIDCEQTFNIVPDEFGI